MKTRLGFAKSDLSSDGARPGRAAPGAPTVAGRAPAGPADTAAPSAPPASPGPAPAPTPQPAETPVHTGKSNFPALAGFWGRRDDQGALVPLTDPGLVPGRWRRREQLARLLRNLVIVAASATLGFFAVHLVMELRARQSPPPVAPSEVTRPAVAPAPPASPGAAPPVTKPAEPRVRKRPVRPSPPRPGADDEVLRPRL